MPLPPTDAATASHRMALGRGFNWLGGATIAAKIVDFLTILVMLLFLTKQQVGVASLVVSIGMVIEALNGLGTSEALLQSRTASQMQLDSLFWYVLGAALSVGLATVLLAPLIATIYGNGGLARYFLLVALKQPIVGAAVIPLALLNRDLQYQRIAIVNLCATVGAALTRLGLAAAGAGTWALVAGYAASGGFILIGATIAMPFRPALRCDLAAIGPLTRFGRRAVVANLGEQMFKNIDYLLIGWFYGASILAVYRVAFDIAMEPAVAVGTLISRTALPVFARVAAIKTHLAETLTWSLSRIANLVAPLMAGIMLAAGPLTTLIHDKQGVSYAAAAMPLRLLAAAALLRVMSMLLSSVMIGSGRPGLAARLAAITLATLGAGILVIGITLRPQAGIVAVAALWLCLYPPLMLWAARYLRRHWNIPAADLARAFARPLTAITLLIAGVELASSLLSLPNPKAQLALVAGATLATYAGLSLAGRSKQGQGALPPGPPLG